MKNLHLLIIVVLLAGCSLFPSKFDNLEHARLVDIQIMARDPKICEDAVASQHNTEAMYKFAQWAELYGRDLPNNDAMNKMHNNLAGMIKELNDRYHAGTVSVFYCKSKLENIVRATDAIIKVSARRPRI